ncbi:MAG: ribbon-helix-helix domain-containing protein [Candidatus Methylarchaceae archaeon HK01M]|nr:ribbon-helix-helix domain-containing protein [Candidatus Methylarchaceae archaeon HK01M]
MRKKFKTSIALDKDLIEWVDKMVKMKRFASRTHAIEYALQRLKERSKNELDLLKIQ